MTWFVFRQLKSLSVHMFLHSRHHEDSPHAEKYHWIWSPCAWCLMSHTAGVQGHVRAGAKVSGLAAAKSFPNESSKKRLFHPFPFGFEWKDCILFLAIRCCIQKPGFEMDSHNRRISCLHDLSWAVLDPQKTERSLIPALMLVSNTEDMGIAMQHMVIEPILWTESDPSAPTDLTEMIFGAEEKELLNLVLNAVPQPIRLDIGMNRNHYVRWFMDLIAVTVDISFHIQVT